MSNYLDIVQWNSVESCSCHHLVVARLADALLGFDDSSFFAVRVGYFLRSWVCCPSWLLNSLYRAVFVLLLLLLLLLVLAQVVQVWVICVELLLF